MISTLYSAKAQRGGRSDIIIIINNTRKDLLFLGGLFIMPIYVIHYYGGHY